MTYKAAQVYTGSEWVDLAVAIADPHQRQLVTVTGTTDTFVFSDGGKAKIYTNSSAVAVTVPEQLTDFDTAPVDVAVTDSE